MIGTDLIRTKNYKCLQSSMALRSYDVVKHGGPENCDFRKGENLTISLEKTYNFSTFFADFLRELFGFQ